MPVTREPLAPDILVRYLRSKGLAVTYARNITDVDDKILDRAKQNDEPPLELSKRMAQVYQESMRALGCLDPDHEPRVSDHLPQIFRLIEKLIARGSAYEVELPSGKRDVYFSVRSFPGYGKLSRRKIDELVVGARVEPGEAKRDPLDFALWKGAAADEWGWDSPWGRGRPGWHIECSAMSTEYLRHGFDVHTGGMDLIFPHHENEIAQSEAAAPEAGPFARRWLHNGFVNVDKEKMSKSLGNFVTVSDVLERNDAQALRWFLLTVHYRGPIQFDLEKKSDGRVIFPGVDEAERRVDYMYSSLVRLRELTASGKTVPN
jgi:cysteinyl-tRNA synthetase